MSRFRRLQSFHSNTLFLLCCFQFALIQSAFSQNQSESVQPISGKSVFQSSGESYPQKVTATNPNYASKSSQQKNVRTLDMVNYEIFAITHKMEYVKSDIELDRIAKNEGWYDEMKQRLKELKKEQKDLSK